MESPRRRTADLVAIAALLAVVSCFFADLFLFDNSLYVRDIARIYYPEREVLREALQSGGLPFWNPQYGGGQPLAANPAYEAFYPAQWLVLLPSLQVGINLEIALHYLLAALGMYLLLRSLGLGQAARLFGAITLALGGLALSFGNLFPFLFSLAWLPWFVMFARRAILLRTRRDLALAALTLGAILLIAEQSMILQSGFLLLAFAARHAFRERKVRPLLIAGAIVAAALVIGSVQIVPALDHQRDSGRSQPFSYDVSATWSMPPARLLELVQPDLFGRFASDAAFYWAAPLYPKNQFPWIFSFYAGIALPVLAMAGFICRTRGWRFVLSLSLLSWLLAIGNHGPLFRLFYLCGMRSIRYPEKFFVSATFLLTVFAAMTFDRLFSDQQVARVTLRISAALAALLVSFWLVTMTAGYPARLASLWDLHGYFGDFVERSRQGAAIAAVVGVTFTILLALRKRLRPSIWLAALAIFLVADLGSRVPGLMPRIQSDFYDPPDAAKQLRAGLASPRQARLFNEADWQLIVNAQPHLPPELHAWRVRGAMRPQMQAMWGFGSVLELDVTQTNLQPAIDFSNMFWRLRQEGRDDRIPLMLEMAGVTHVATLRPDAAQRPDDPIQVIPLGGGARYYMAQQIVATRSTDDALANLHTQTAWSPRVAFAETTPFTPAPARITRAQETQNAIALDVEAAGKSALVLAVTRHKYWHASIDGLPTTIWPANIAFQGMTIPHGRHHVELTYRNPLVVAFGFVSLTGLVLLVLAAVIRERPRDLAA